MKITLVIFSLSCGGAQRVMSILANNWAKCGEDVTLISMDSLSSDFYPLNSRINRVALNLKKGSLTPWIAVRNNIIRLNRLRAEIRKSRPQCVISFMDRMNIITLLATRGLAVPVIVSEHTDSRLTSLITLLKLLRYITYKRANAVVVLTNELRDVIGRFITNRRLYVIPNPALRMDINDDVQSEISLPKKYIVTVGRLVPEKGYDMLITAFSQCKETNYSLVIVGDGVERKSLQLLSSKLGLDSRILFTGSIHNSSAILKNAELFVLSSRREGFPMALIEAMSCGLAVISFDGLTGPTEIIENEINGILVQHGNIDALVSTIDFLLANPERRKKLGKHATKVVQKYSIEMVMGKWNSLINDLIQK